MPGGVTESSASPLRRSSRHHVRLARRRGLPLITAIIGIMIGSLGITVATGFMDLSSMTPTLAIMIGLAVAIDYSLFIVSRSSTSSHSPTNREEAAGRAVGTAGSAVVFAGLTVIIALVALRVVGIRPVRYGSAAASTVFIAVLIALTLLPAILGLSAARPSPVASRAEPARPEGDDGKKTFSQRYGRAVVRRPAVGLILGVVLLGALAIPAAKLELAPAERGQR